MNLKVLEPLPLMLLKPHVEKQIKLWRTCTYISLSASHFNKHPKLISVVGEDFPKEMIALFHQKGINTEGLQIKHGEKTFFWSGKYHNDMNTRDTVDTQLNVLETFDPVVPNSYQDCDILIL